MTDPRTIVVPKAVRGRPARFLFGEASYTVETGLSIDVVVFRAGRTDQTTSVDYTITAEVASGGGETVIPLYPNTRNPFKGTAIQSSSRYFDITNPRYLYSRLANGGLVQLGSLIADSERPLRVAQWRQLHADNPLFQPIMHSTPYIGCNAYETKSRVFESLEYKWLNQNPREFALVHTNINNWNTSLESLSAPDSGTESSSVAPNISYAPYRSWMAQAATDLLVGSDLAQNPDFPATGGDLSDFCVFFHDRTTLREPASSEKVQRAQATGAIISVESTVGSQIREITIPDPGLATEDYPLQNMMFIPPTGTTGFIGYAISSGVGNGSTASITLSPLPKTADGVTQDSIPVAGWLYTICDDSDLTTGLDWNGDGVADDLLVGARVWIPNWLAYWDEINANVLQETGHETGRGWNGISKSWEEKESDGWDVPHQMSNSGDYNMAENANRKWGFEPNTTAEGHGYKVNNYDPEDMVRFINYAATFINPNPNTFMQKWSTGAMIEILWWGNGSYTTTNALDASFLRFNWAVVSLIEKTTFSTQGSAGSGSGSNDPMVIEESFLDFDTDYSTPTPIATYLEDDPSIPDGPKGPKHSITWATPDAGERIYLRRIGNFIIAVNMAALPAGYGTQYLPSHLSGGFAPRTNDDQILPADFAAMITNGLITSNDTLSHVDFSAYKNDRITNWLRDKDPATWDSFDYGPQQPHPSDNANYTVATLPLIARDPTLNDGSTVNTAATYNLGPAEAVVWQINSPDAPTGPATNPSTGTLTFAPGDTYKAIVVTAGGTPTTDGVIKLSNPQLLDGLPVFPVLGTQVVAPFVVSGDPVDPDPGPGEGPDPIGSHPNYQNGFEGNMASSVSRLFDPTDPRYIWGGIATGGECQLLKLTSQANRDERAPEWLAFHERNPMFLVKFHGTPYIGCPAYAQKSNIYDTYEYLWLNQNPRQQAIVHFNPNNWQTRLEGNATPSSGFSVAEVPPNISYEPYKAYIAAMATDLLTGSSVATNPDIPATGYDISAFCTMFHDRTTFQEFAANSKLQRSQQDGNLVSVDSVVGTQVRQVTIDSTPGSGVEGEDILFFPSSGTTGFVGYSITNYVDNGSTSTLTLGSLPGTADGVTQPSVPTSSWRYTICDSNNTTNRGAWDVTGGDTDQLTSALFWVPHWLDYWDTINANVLQLTGHQTGRGWNGVVTSWNTKENAGYAAPHPMYQAADYCTMESAAESMWKFETNTTAEGHGYTVDRYDPETMMRAHGFGATFWNPNPNTFMQNWHIGTTAECLPWGNGDYSDVNALDATYMRFHWAVTKFVTGIAWAAQSGSGSTGDPYAIEECFLDLDTNYVEPPPIGTYLENDLSLPVGNFGPRHSWTWGTPDAGERIFIRRVGDFIIAANMADIPAGYGDSYNPSHLPGGFTPRTNDDQILPADFAALITKGYLASNETLTHIDPSTYVNDRVTTWMRTNAPSVWTGFSYGPQQPHPNDNANYTVANVPLIARDPTMNDGSLVNPAVAYDLGPAEAVVWQVRQKNEIKIHPTNPLWFEYGGQAIYLGGHQLFRLHQTQATSRDMPAIMDTPGALDKYLEDLKTDRGMNNIRLWTYFSSDSTNPVSQCYPLPYLRSGPGKGADGSNLVDLTRTHQTFYDRVEEIVSKCEALDIIVTYLLWDVYGFQGTRWPWNPFNAGNNINGIDCDSTNNGRGLDGMFEEPIAENVTAAQVLFEEKLLDTINPYANVIIEVHNEFGRMPFHETVMNRVRSYELTLPKQHLVMISAGGLTDNGTFTKTDVGKAAVLATTCDVIAPGTNQFSGTWGDTDGVVPIQDWSNRPVIMDMDHIEAGLRDPIHFWRSFTRGYHYNLFESNNASGNTSVDYPYTVLGWEGYMNNTEDDVIRKNIGWATDRANNHFKNLANMNPDDGTGAASTGYVLYDPGVEYVVFSEPSSSFTVRQLQAGQIYDYQWFNSTSGLPAGSQQSVTPSGTSQSFNPSQVNYVLHLWRRD